MAGGLPLAQPLIPLPRRLLLLGGLAAAFAIGALMTARLPVGLALLLVTLYVPLALLNLNLAIAGWVALMMVSRLPQVWVAPTAASLVILFAWIGGAQARRALPSPWKGPARAFPAVTGALLAWLTLSALWAREPASVGAIAWQWYAAVLVAVVVATTVRTLADVRVVLLGFFLGATFSVAIGLAADGLQGSNSAYDSATTEEGRLAGGAGNPNYLAAVVVPALVLGTALLRDTRDALARLGLGCSMVVLAVGLLATQSRGGLLALVASALTALVVMRGRRAQIALGMALVAALAAAWFAATPAALQRVTSADQGGNGRSELWAVAGRMAADRPLTGVGLNNFRGTAREYTRDVGTLRFAELIAERPRVVHNVYLQQLAETGIPGLVLLLGALALVVRCAREALRRFRAAGDRTGSAYAEALLVSLVAVVVASLFLSNGPDVRSWLLFGLAPALLLIARRVEDAGGRALA